MTPPSAPAIALPAAATNARSLVARRRACHVVAALLAAVPYASLITGRVTAAELPPGLVADFTRQVQPLILNKCAAGACHGGPTAHAPRFQRGGVGGQFDRSLTLSNIATLDETIRSAGSAASFLTTISARHPVSGSSRHKLVPLTTAERAVLERWIAAAAGRRPAPFSPAGASPLAATDARPVTVAAATGPATAPASGAFAPDRLPTPTTPPGPTGALSPTKAIRLTSDADDTASGAAAHEPPAQGKGKPAATAAVRPNRFRAMLDAAANPPPLPPPQEPQGILLRDTVE
jgi:hypothetical protein